MVIDSHLSTRVSKKRTNAFSLSYINAWKKKYVTTYIRKRREKKEGRVEETRKREGEEKEKKERRQSLAKDFSSFSSGGPPREDRGSKDGRRMRGDRASKRIGWQ